MQVSLQLYPRDYERLRSLPFAMHDAIKRSARKIAMRTTAAVQPHVPHATGQLARSIRPIATQNGADVLVDSLYGKAVHDGRSEGYKANEDSLLAWMRVKGIPDSALFPIARKLFRDGVAAVPFMRDYVDSLDFEVMAQTVMREEVSRALV